MELYGSFEERGYKVEAYMPSSPKEPLEWLVKAYKKGKLVKEIRIPMFYEPIFGVDVDDAKTLEEKTDELLKLLL